ncbi:hypothetical protein LCGC14_2946570 [marine sediment metagenome]|uniref:Uncharacterized protein n=1 Tax=marine sediment metagenome TaxID=412755 RepID=A0A0F8Y3K8_9ZZZZ
MRQWRRRNRNLYGRVPRRRGRRYADALPPVVNNIFDAAVAYYEEKERVRSGGSSEARLKKRAAKLQLTVTKL